MNKFQRLVMVATAMNVLLILLFPPFASHPLAKGMIPGLQGFYPVFMQLGKLPIHTGLLTMELMFITINALLAWLLLNGRKNEGNMPDFGFAKGILWVAAANLLLIFVFPPYESARGLIRGDVGVFEGFYFVFGANYRRVIFAPLLYLEGLLIAINTLAIYLLFSVIRNAHDRREERIAELAAKLTPDELERLTDELRQRITDESQQPESQIGRHGDRRQAPHAPPPEGDRRKGNRRESGHAH